MHNTCTHTLVNVCLDSKVHPIVVTDRLPAYSKCIAGASQGYGCGTQSGSEGDCVQEEKEKELQEEERYNRYT